LGRKQMGRRWLGRMERLKITIYNQRLMKGSKSTHSKDSQNHARVHTTLILDLSASFIRSTYCCTLFSRFQLFEALLVTAASCFCTISDPSLTENPSILQAAFYCLKLSYSFFFTSIISPAIIIRCPLTYFLYNSLCSSLFSFSLSLAALFYSVNCIISVIFILFLALSKNFYS